MSKLNKHCKLIQADFFYSVDVHFNNNKKKSSVFYSNATFVSYEKY